VGYHVGTRRGSVADISTLNDKQRWGLQNDREMETMRGSSTQQIRSQPTGTRLRTVQCSTVHYTAEQRSTLQCSTLHYSTALYSLR
jgi:hypothetical protein